MNSVEISGLIPKLGLVVVGIVLVECTRQGLNYLQRKNSKPVIRQVIFFPDKQIACKDFFDSVEGCSRICCDFSHTTTGFRLDIYEFFVCRSMNVKDNLYFITFCNAGNYFPTSSQQGNLSTLLFTASLVLRLQMLCCNVTKLESESEWLQTRAWR